MTEPPANLDSEHIESSVMDGASLDDKFDQIRRLSNFYGHPLFPVPDTLEDFVNSYCTKDGVTGWFLASIDPRNGSSYRHLYQQLCAFVTECINAGLLLDRETGQPIRIPTQEDVDEYRAAEPKRERERQLRAKVEESKLFYQARDIAQQELRAERDTWKPPTNDDGESGLFSDLLQLPPSSERMIIDDLLGFEHNASLAAPYKTGKTTLGLNVARALVDELPFLGKPTYLPAGRRVGWVNGEMSRDDLMSYVRIQGIQHPERIAGLNLRGRRLDLTDDRQCQWFVDWLISHDCQVLIIDSWARLLAWAGMKSNDNDEIADFTARLDEIKERANVSSLLVLAHFGRKEHKEGKEHARGATHLDDWVDARWVMTVDEFGSRFIEIEGRNVSLSSTKLDFDPTTGRIALGEGNKAASKESAMFAVIAQIVSANPGIGATELRGQIPGDTTEKAGWVAKAVSKGIIEMETNDTGTRKRYYPARS